jgi:hypothetical protein
MKLIHQLIQPITQTTGIDPLVQGLSAFLLGVCYEFNREPGEITRSTLHPILHSRIGPDQFVSRMARLREDPRFKAVQPDAFENEPPAELPQEMEEDPEDGLELWFDWAFVDFWKNHYCEPVLYGVSYVPNIRYNSTVHRDRPRCGPWSSWSVTNISLLGAFADVQPPMTARLLLSS